MTVRISNVFGNDTLNRAITIESNGDPNAMASSSTATGLGQYLNQSWLGMLYEAGPLNIARRIKKTGNPKKPFSVPDGGERAILDMRKAKGKPELLKLNIDILARDWEGHAKFLGKGWNDGDLYLCHFLGRGSAKKLLHADPNATAVSVCGQAAANANPTIFWHYSNKVRGRAKTCAELRAWALNAMKTRWENHHPPRPDWIAMYYPEHAQMPEPADLDAPEAAGKPPMKVDVHERDDDDETGPAEAPAEPEPAPVPVPVPRSRPVATTKPAPEGETIKGDPEIWWVQYRLKMMHYYLGVLDGGYGGKLAGAIAGFLNDRHEAITPPNNHDTFCAILDELKDALDRAEADGFERPVTEARKRADPEIVDEVAPEAKPVKRNFFTGIIASALTLVGSIFNGLKEDLSGAWEFFTSHQDDIPDDLKDTAKEHAFGFLSGVPMWVWMIGAAVIFAMFALNSGSGLKQIIDKVKTGER